MHKGICVSTGSGAVVFDGRRGTSFQHTLTGDTAASIVNMRPGKIYVFTFVQNDVGGYTLDFPDAMQNATPVDPGAGNKTKQMFECEADGRLNALAAAAVL